MGTLRGGFPTAPVLNLATALALAIRIARRIEQNAGREIPVGITRLAMPNDALFGAFLPVNPAAEFPFVLEFRQDHVRMFHASLAASVDGLR